MNFDCRGLKQVIIDYVHNPTLQRVCKGGLAVVTLLCVSGLLVFNLYDVGVSGALHELWHKLGKDEDLPLYMR